jgi:hypothetical protein
MVEDKIYKRDKSGCFVRVDGGQSSTVLEETQQKAPLRASVELAEQNRVLKKICFQCVSISLRVDWLVL